MKILITGANGMLARAAVAHCRAIGDEVIALAREELDIADRDAVFAAFENERPETVLNCAAFTDVDGAESNVEKCFSANAIGPENLALAAKEFNSILLTISTDYVFDGSKDGFYTENDKPNPLSVYSRSKFDGEKLAAAANPMSIIIRSGWIYGEHGTNFLSVMKRLLADGKHIKAITDSCGTPTFAADLAARMRELAAAKASGIFHATNRGPGASYFKFASTVAEIAGLDANLIEPISKESLNRPAARPTNSRLACARGEKLGLATMRDWKDALSAFLVGK
ncbi:MAG: dTDP-4-dehydrorhamnose reductase [Pyrinomonadaceae bacterium]